MPHYLGRLKRTNKNQHGGQEKTLGPTRNAEYAPSVLPCGGVVVMAAGFSKLL
jgi:hypothetical protein